MENLSRKKFSFEEHYDMISEWWKSHRSHVPPKEFLSQTGIVIYDEKPLAVGFLYKTDSAFCYFAFAVVNPESAKEKRDRALEFLIDSACEWATKAGFKSVLCNSEYKKFTKRLENKGFFRPVKHVDHLFYDVQEN